MNLGLINPKYLTHEKEGLGISRTYLYLWRRHDKKRRKNKERENEQKRRTERERDGRKRVKRGKE